MLAPAKLKGKSLLATTEEHSEGTTSFPLDFSFQRIVPT